MKDKKSILLLLVILFFESVYAVKIKEFILKDSSFNSPTVIVCPGGSYCYLGKRIEGTNVAKWLNKNGLNAVVLSYRVGYGHKHPEMIEDIQQLIYLLKINHNALKIDSSKIGVMGFSAGGHLAGMSAMYGDTSFIKKDKESISLMPNFVFMIYPVVSMQDELAHEKSRRNLLGKTITQEMKDGFSIEKNIRQNFPPFFIIHSKNDATVMYQNSVVLADSLKEKNIPHKFLLYENGNHGYAMNAKKAKDANNWKNESIKWINSILENEK